MEIQLQELIDQIKKDGVEAAETQAEAILTAAKAEAEKIISDAKVQAEKLILDAKTENERTVKSGEDALRYALRDRPAHHDPDLHHPALSRDREGLRTPAVA
ncbi:MAG: hypothetical protein IJN49_05075, partial [Clostridia bacterium]|nr:hypothetical protein [Clostridia bacterium]